MIKDNIVKGEIIIQYCPTGDMWADINTKALQRSLFHKTSGCLMGIGESYDDDIERLNNHPDLIPSQECAYNVSVKDISVLPKSGAVVKVIGVAQNAFPNATKKTYCFSVRACDRTLARQCHFYVPNVRHLMRTTRLS